jgi:lipid-binding SYLF domain-containing protein
MFRYFSLVVCIAFSTASLEAANKEQARLETAGVVMQEILDVPDNIPQELLDKAECVIVIPSVTKVALGIGGAYGRGAMACRSGKLFTGPWGAPAMYVFEGGSVGFQIGGSETDVIMLFMTDNSVRNLLEDKFEIGGEASAAAGPVGRTAKASTDAQLQAQILSYSRSKGLFAGLSLSGVVISPDNDANMALYSHTAKEILNGGSLKPPVVVPPATKPFQQAVARYAR